MNSVIERMHRGGKTASEILKALKGTVSRSGVFKALKRLRETGSTQPRVSRTLERPVRTKKLIKSIREKLRRLCVPHVLRLYRVCNGRIQGQ